MTNFGSVADRDAIENAMSWENRDVAKSVYDMLSRTKDRHGSKNAVSFQILSGPTDKAETLTWNDLHAKVTQAANLFRSIGVGEKDVVAYLLPNANETVITLLGGCVAGIANPVNPLLDPEQIGAISSLAADLNRDLSDLAAAQSAADGMSDAAASAEAYADQVKPYFDKVRTSIDKLEVLVEDKIWRLPKYRELLFIR